LAASTLIDFSRLGIQVECPGDRDWLLAEREGLQGILAYGHASHCQQSAQRYRQIFARNAHALAQLAHLARAVQSYQGRVLVLKGGALIANVYSQIGLRPLSDIDLLIPENQLDSFGEALLRSGFYRRLGERQFHRDGVIFDIHLDPIQSQRIRARRGLYHFPQEELWDRAQALGQDYPGLSILEVHDHYLQLCVHALKHGFRRLIWLVDLALLRDQCNPDLLWQKALSSGSTRPLLYADELLSHFTALPTHYASSGVLSLWERLYLKQIQRRRNLELLTPWITALAIQGWRARAAYLAECFWPQEMGRVRFRSVKERVGRLLGRLRELL